MGSMLDSGAPKNTSNQYKVDSVVIQPVFGFGLIDEPVIVGKPSLIFPSAFTE
jgi:hypothetical protein